MHLVDYINSVFSINRSKICFLTQITDIVNTVVACGVDFNNIKNRSAFNSPADFAFVAGIAVNGRKAVYCF